MKNLFARMTKLTLSLVAVFSLSSCGEDLITTDEQPVNPSEEKMTVFASVTDGTRTTIDANGIFRWQTVRVNNDEVNDQIWIDKDGTGASFSLQSSSSEFYADNRMGKFYFRGSLGANTYKLSYTGHGSTTGDEVTIAANQQQVGWDNADHIGTSGDCATAEATKQTDGNYTFTLQHKANYLIFQPYAPASTDLNPYRLVDIEIVDTEGNVLAGTFPLKYDGLQASSGTNTFTSVRVTCQDAIGNALQLPQSASKSIYAVILPRGAAEGGRALQVRYRVNTVSDGNFIVVQKISGNFEVNGARLIRHDLSVPAFPTVTTFQSDGNGLFGGTKFKPAFLYRTDGNATTGNVFQLKNMKDDPFILLQYNQGASIVPAPESEWSRRMFFHYNELAVIFGHVGAGQGSTWLRDISNSKSIDGKLYKMPSSLQYLTLIETPNAGRATVNYYPASFAAVKVDLSADATYASKGWSHTAPATTEVSADYIMGYLFFPDESVILDAKIQVASLNGRWNTTYSELTADDIRNYTAHGCMFLPAMGLSSINSSNNIGWATRGRAGRLWTGNISADLNSLYENSDGPANHAARFRFDGDMLRVAAYGREDLCPVVLVEQ